MAYFGRGPTDLCYLLLSSSTLTTRLKNREFLLNVYFDTLMSTLDTLGTQIHLTIDDLRKEYVASLPYCLVFCANAQDFVPDPKIETGNRDCL